MSGSDLNDLWSGWNTIISKHSAKCLGYIEDPYIDHFIPTNKIRRRSPIINRGYHIRWFAMRTVLNWYDGNFENYQVIVLGSGLDTTHFNLRTSPKLQRFLEIDKENVIIYKAQLLTRSEVLENIVVYGDKYFLIPGDLEDPKDIIDKIAELTPYKSIATLVISEVALAYVSNEKSDDLLSRLCQMFPALTYCSYEQINPDDCFGRLMVSSFDKIKAPLQHIKTYKTVDDLHRRYSGIGFKFRTIIDMANFENEIVDAQERNRINEIEPFDEFEAWYMKLKHYSISICSNYTQCLKLVSYPVELPTQRTFVNLKNDSVHCIRRYAHSIATDYDYIVLTGGVGHFPTTSLLKILRSTNCCYSLDVESCRNNRRYHTSHLLGNQIVILFGRFSPLMPLPCKMVNLNFSQIRTLSESIGYERWRHASCVAGNASEIYVFGGINLYTNKKFVKFFLMKFKYTNDLKFETIMNLGNSPPNRHSHSLKNIAVFT